MSTDTHSYELSSQDVEFLLERIEGPLADRMVSAKQKGTICAKGQYDTGRLAVLLDEGDSEQMVDKLGDMLMTEGLGEDSEPNAVGRKIEGLIDIFSRDDV